jgi:hypothetical protein
MAHDMVETTVADFIGPAMVADVSVWLFSKKFWAFGDIDKQQMITKRPLLHEIVQCILL